MLAGDLKKILIEAHDDTDLAHDLAYYIAQPSRHGVDGEACSGADHNHDAWWTDLAAEAMERRTAPAMGRLRGARL